MKAIIFDADGMLLLGDRFSDRYSKEYGVPFGDMAPFFAWPFDECIHGRADIKEELVNGGWLQKWHWKRSVEDLLDYWFETGNTIDERILASVAQLRKKGIVCVLSTNQEKYRAAYLKDKLGLAQHFDALFVSSELGYKKPDPRFFDSVMEFLQHKDASIQKSDVLFWDDRMAYQLGAQKFGFQANVYTDFGSYERTMASLIPKE